MRPHLTYFFRPSIRYKKASSFIQTLDRPLFIQVWLQQRESGPLAWACGAGQLSATPGRTSGPLPTIGWVPPTTSSRWRAKLPPQRSSRRRRPQPAQLLRIASWTRRPSPSLSSAAFSTRLSGPAIRLPPSPVNRARLAGSRH